MGGWLCPTTDDAQTTFTTLKDRGVDIDDNVVELTQQL